MALILPVLFAAAALYGAIASIAVAREKREVRWLLPGIAAIAFAFFLGYLTWAQAHYRDGVELNVSVSASDVVGSWSCEKKAVTILSDGTWTTPDGSRGFWKVDLGSFRSRTQWAVEYDAWALIRDQGALALVEMRDEDPDSWDLSCRLRRH